jgi:transcriptional regulator with XRE-family HTH domain
MILNRRPPICGLVGRNLRQARVSRDMSQGHLAWLTDISRCYINGLEQGHRNPCLSILDRLATALDVETRDLLAPEKPG